MFVVVVVFFSLCCVGDMFVVGLYGVYAFFLVLGVVLLFGKLVCKLCGDVLFSLCVLCSSSLCCVGDMFVVGLCLRMPGLWLWMYW